MIYQPEQIQHIASDAMAALVPAFDRSQVLDVGEWIERCADDLAQLWRNGDLWAISEVQNTHMGRVLHIVACAGVWDDGALLEEIEDWGRSMECNQSYLTGRRGWARKLPGYSVATITLKKGL